LAVQKILMPCVPPFKVTQGHRNQHRSVGCL